MIMNDSRRGGAARRGAVWCGVCCADAMPRRGSNHEPPPFSVTQFNDVLNDVPYIARLHLLRTRSPLLGMQNEIYHSPTMVPSVGGNGDLKAQA